MIVHWGYLIQCILSVVRFNSQVLSYRNPDCLLFIMELFMVESAFFLQPLTVMGAVWCYWRVQRLNVKDDKESILLKSLFEIFDRLLFMMGPFMIELRFFLQLLIVMGAFLCYRRAQRVKVKDAKENILLNFLSMISS